MAFPHHQLRAGCEGPPTVDTMMQSAVLRHLFRSCQLAPPAGGGDCCALQRAVWLWYVCLVLLSGCGYLVGSPHRPDVRTVHVPIFANETYRRGFEVQLTEAVQKRIQDRTPYRLAGPHDADTVLIGRVTGIEKRLTNQTRFDDPRELELELGIDVRWEDRRTGQVLAERRIPLGARGMELVSRSTFAPETGQSLATATQDVTKQLAQQIVGLMELPW